MQDLMGKIKDLGHYLKGSGKSLPLSLQEAKVDIKKPVRSIQEKMAAWTWALVGGQRESGQM